MTEEQALLAAVKAHPDDDLPRLVLADWLDEQGQPDCAEFIRLQVELAKLQDESEILPEHDGRRVILETREAELLEEYHNQWIGPWKRRKNTHGFHRGLIRLIFRASDHP